MATEDLKTYKLQLQQVDAALTTDPENAELQELKKNLMEVILLTSELAGVPADSSDAGTSLEGADPSGAGTGAEGSEPAMAWNVGDKCLAFYQEDEQYYEAEVEEVLDDGTYTVTFAGYNNSAICLAHQVKPLDNPLKRGAKGGQAGDAKKSKKDLMAEQREYKRKKAQKKALRMKQLEEEHETDKNKWLDFNAKTFSKTTKGRVKKSIFATPDTVQGKVGVGTCGSGGKPMTSYQHQEKWKK